jgi:serine/threonine protein kinase
MPSAECNLFDLIEKDYFVKKPEIIQHTFYQIVCGVNALHEKGIMHRDIKAENILHMGNNIYTLCDFGLSKTFGIPGEAYTDYMITRCYRSPENHAETEDYSFGVDIWSLGCLFCELVLNKLPFDEDESMESLQSMWSVFGSQELLDTLPYFQEAKDCLKKNHKKKFQRQWQEDFVKPIQEQCGEEAIDLLKSIFKLDPSERCTAKQILEHKYFENIKHSRGGEVIVSDNSTDVKEDLPSKEEIAHSPDIPSSVKTIKTIEIVQSIENSWLTHDSQDFHFPTSWLSNQNLVSLEHIHTIYLFMYEVARECGMISRVIYKAYSLFLLLLSKSEFRDSKPLDLIYASMLMLDFSSKLFGCELFRVYYFDWKPSKISGWKEMFPWLNVNALKKDFAQKVCMKQLKTLERKILKSFSFQLDIHTGYDIFWNERVNHTISNYPHEEEDEEIVLRSKYKLLLFHPTAYFEYQPKALIQKLIDEPAFWNECVQHLPMKTFKKKCYREFNEDFETLLEQPKSSSSAL